MKYLVAELAEIKKHIPQKDVLVTSVSSSNVAWHLSHCLLVITSIYKAMSGSDPVNYKSEFNWLRLVVFTIGYFPRGKAKSPKIVKPPDDISAEHITAQLSEVEKLLESYGQLDKNAHFKHPYFKVLNKRQAIRFLKLHTVHHLKIIRDILKAGWLGVLGLYVVFI